MHGIPIEPLFCYDIRMSVTVRMAPSPTGNLHIGTARAGLFNWLFARHHGGRFIMRIEDTDLERSKPEYEADILEGFRWLGLEWDNAQLYRQSERLDLYRSHLRRLLDSGAAVWKEYSDAEKAELVREGRTVRDRIIVLKPDGDPEREVVFDDAIRGRVAVLSKHVGQIALAKDEDTPLYNFAVVVDDIEMAISHVIRGEDHISNTPKQLAIYEALGVKPPVFAHLPLILGPDRSKLSKRHGSTSITEYRRDYLPDALVNFIALLGHTYDGELMDRSELVRQFSLERVHKSGAIFDVAKLDWMNAQYLKRLSPAAFRELIGKPSLPDAAVPLMTERLDRLSNISRFSYLWEDPGFEPALLTWKDDAPAVTRQALQAVRALVSSDGLTTESLDALAASEFGGRKGSVYWPLRVALSGLQNSAGPLDILRVIGPERALARIDAALAALPA
jgi:glutamyl/glutaminyl-tRNA synthetase